MSNEQRGREALQELNKALKSRDRAEKWRPLTVVAAAAVVILVAVGGIWYATVKEDPTPVLAMERENALPETVQCTYTDSGEAAKEVSLPNGTDVSATGTVHVSLETNDGTIGLDLDRSASPCTVNSFVHLAEEGYYDDTVCHRETSGQLNVLQCGDPTGLGTGGPGYVFDDEYPVDEADSTTTSITYPRGTLAMANSGTGTNGSQFFMNYDDSLLPPAYSYFGTVDDEGMDTLAAIAERGIEDGSDDGAPAEEVRIISATVTA